MKMEKPYGSHRRIDLGRRVLATNGLVARSDNTAAMAIEATNVVDFIKLPAHNIVFGYGRASLTCQVSIIFPF
jgi:hypothetical protein